MNKLLITGLIITIIGCNYNDVSTGSTDNDIKYLTPENISYSIIKVYPHDTGSFTQGLVVYNGSMYEGTGEYGRSKLLKVNLATGKPEKEIALDKKYFGEGITILNDTIYQLTYKEKVVFAYSVKDFKKIKEFPLNKDGWGITTDGKNLIVSDGTNNLYFYQPSTFKLLHTLAVTETGSPAFNLNELEYINGFIYANQWQYNYILKINPSNGQVVGKADLSAMVNRVKAKDPNIDFLNGIAYDAASKKIYVTGKRWPYLYEIEFSH